MATDVRTLAADNTSDATFRAWAQAIDAAITAVGLVAASDTGQVDLTTVLKPTVAATSAGYKIYRFNDALQATAPVFIKIEFGTGTAATNPAVWVTVGNATNGAGTLTGQVGTRTQLAITGSTTAAQCLTSGSSSRLTLMFWRSLQSQKIWMSIERTRDANGNEDSTGVFVHLVNATSANNHQVVPQTGAVPTQLSGTPSIVGPLTTQIRGTNTGICPIFPMIGGMYNPIIGAVVYSTNDIGLDTQFSLTMYGVAHNYRALENPGGASNWGAAYGVNTNQYSMAMLWE